MLIVNADDFGASASATEAILATLEAGVVSSASAMVWMPDSERSARLAELTETELGLHLNLTLLYGADDVPAEVAERQRLVAASFDKESWRRGHVDAVDKATLAAVIEDQLTQFRAQFGEPTHINGHHHVHVVDVVLDLLPREIPIRQALSSPGQVHLPDDRIVHIRENFRAPWATFDLVSVHPELKGHPLEVLQELAERPIEVVVHPHLDGQKNLLMAEPWRRTLAATGLTTFRELDRRPQD